MIALTDREVIQGVSDDRLISPIAVIIGELQRTFEIDHLARDPDLLNRFADRSLMPTLV